MVRIVLYILLISVLVIASLGLVGIVLAASPLVWTLLAFAVFISVTGLLFWGVNGGPRPMD